jgi:hypothetical protein
MVTAANQIQFARHPVWHFPEVRFSSDPLATSSSAETVSMIIINNSNFCLGLLTRSSNRDSDISEAISDILSGARRAGHIIQRIRGMAYRTPPERTSLDFKDVIADVLALTRRELAEHRIEVRTEFAEDVPPVSADRVQLQQVLLNLVMNGIDAMSGLEDERRKLTISGSRDEQRRAMQAGCGRFSLQTGQPRSASEGNPALLQHLCGDLGRRIDRSPQPCGSPIAILLKDSNNGCRLTACSFFSDCF